MCGMNLAFDRKLIGPAMYFGLMGHGQPIGRYDDMWAGWCTKVCRSPHNVHTWASIVHATHIVNQVALDSQTHRMVTREGLLSPLKHRGFLPWATHMYWCMDSMHIYQ